MEAIDTNLAGVPTEPSVAALAPARMEGSLVRPAADLGQIERSFRDYSALCDRLLVPDDFQQIGNKQFRKKSAWRKLAVAFGVSCEIRSREYERDGRHIIRAEVVERATAPNGRFMDGLGACDAFERCCENPCKKRTWSNHECCKPDCNGFVHFSKPNHDIPATAATRARNRACADLFGMGEVSAEEITGDGDHQPAAPPDPEAAFKVIGWNAKAEHDAFRNEVTTRAGKLSDELRADFKGEWASLDFVWAELTPKDVADKVIAALTEYEAIGSESAEAPQQPETASTPFVSAYGPLHSADANGRTCDGCGQRIVNGNCGCPF